MKTKTKKSTHTHTITQKIPPKMKKINIIKCFTQLTLKKVKEHYYITMTFLHRKLL